MSLECFYSASATKSKLDYWYSRRLTYDKCFQREWRRWQWTTLLGQQFYFNLVNFFLSVVSLSTGLSFLYSYYHIKYCCPQGSVYVCKSIRSSAFMVLHMKKKTFICLWSHPCSPTSQLPGPFHWKTGGGTLGTKLFAHLIYRRKHKLVCVYKFKRNSCGYSFTVPL